MAQDPKYETGKLYPLPIGLIDNDLNQPRTYFDQEAIAELSQSIQKVGVLNPILVRQAENGRFVIVAGERRYRAAGLAGILTLPAIVIEGDPLEIGIIENLQRENLTAIEEAEALASLKSAKAYRLGDLSKLLGKSEPALCKLLALNKLPDSVKDDCRNDPRTSREILAGVATQKTQEKMEALYRKYKESGLTRGELRAARPKAQKKESTIDLAFITNCTKLLGALELEKLDPAQSQSVSIDLDSLRLEIEAKLRQLVAPAA